MPSMDIVERVQRLLRQPAVEWEVIDAEPHTVPELFTRYVMPLAAIPPVCAFLGYSVIGISNARLPLSYGVTHFVLSYGLSIFSVYVLALAIDGLAQPFGGQRNFLQAMKVSAFAPTAAWLAGAFSLVPWVSILSLVGGVYSLYLLYLAIQPSQGSNQYGAGSGGQVGAPARNRAHPGGRVREFRPLRR